MARSIFKRNGETVTSSLHRRFVDNLRLVREQQKVSQYEMARRLNTSRPYISDLERGRHCPTLDLVQRVADALRIDASRLLQKNPNRIRS